ncbi:unnamed protein product [Darwinula stevensoni]|uniref:Uncharacterized protein n=1 Tax=Darwinula stevensoni TaxID=69355 RepID=A0A7R8X1K9_9CRUS|nr:unnamed protein product [Darwinula stevensoni]CAG0882326.1 unnamed protein product [Darwinula stevensoni]
MEVEDSVKYLNLSLDKNLPWEGLCGQRPGFLVHILICTNLSSPMYHNYSIVVQQETSDYNLYRSLVESLPAIISSFFLGPWSDEYGRKPAIILSLLGALLSGLGYLLVGLVPSYGPEFMLIPAVISGLSGGVVAFLMAIFSYIGDTTPLEIRSAHVALTDASRYMGAPLGMLASGYIYKRWGSVAIFGTGATVIFLALVYVTIYIKEPHNAERKSFKVSCTRLCQGHHARDYLKTVLRRRDGYQRTEILCLLATMCLWLIPFSGTVIFVPILSYKLKMPDYLLGILSSLSYCANMLVTGFAVSSWHMYYGTGLGCLRGIGTISIRSMLSKIVLNDELGNLIFFPVLVSASPGKIYSVLASCEAAIPLFATAIYTQLYVATVATIPGASYFLCAAIIILPIIMFLVLWRLDQKGDDSHFAPLDCQHFGRGHQPLDY